MQLATQATSKNDPFTPRMLRDAQGAYQTGVAVVTAIDTLAAPAVPDQFGARGWRLRDLRRRGAPSQPPYTTTPG